MFIITGILAFWYKSGIVTVDPNDAVVYQLCGKYIGTLKEAGMWVTVPWYTKKKVSLKKQNFESSLSTVTDSTGCPIEI